MTEFGEGKSKIVGKILFHFYINYSLFPIQFCRSTMQYVMGIECKPSDFIRSFLDCILKRDSEILHDTLYNMNFNREKIIEILSQYGIRSVPTRTNVADLVTKAAVSELLSKPLTELNVMKESFENYFDGLPRQSIEAIYEQYNPTQEKVLDHSDFKEPCDKMEESAFEYLNRYIDESTFPTLQKLLKFVMNLKCDLRHRLVLSC